MIPVFAHQGGWDEILLVAVPLVALALLLALANARARRLTDGDPGTDTDDDADGSEATGFDRDHLDIGDSPPG